MNYRINITVEILSANLRLMTRSALLNIINDINVMSLLLNAVDISLNLSNVDSTLP